MVVDSPQDEGCPPSPFYTPQDRRFALGESKIRLRRSGGQGVESGFRDTLIEAVGHQWQTNEDVNMRKKASASSSSSLCELSVNSMNDRRDSPQYT